MKITPISQNNHNPNKSQNPGFKAIAVRGIISDVTVNSTKKLAMVNFINNLRSKIFVKMMKTLPEDRSIGLDETKREFVGLIKTEEGSERENEIMANLLSNQEGLKGTVTSISTEAADRFVENLFGETEEALVCAYFK